MKHTTVGVNPEGRSIDIDPRLEAATHTHIVGSSGTGKSKLMESLIRQAIRRGRRLCLVDWHGTLYKSVLQWCAYHGVGVDGDTRRLVLLDPANPDFITGFNPFMKSDGDVSTIVSNRIAATIKPWGQTNTNDMPSFERACRLLYTYAVEAKQTLPNAAHLLSFDRSELRREAARAISNTYVRAKWEDLLLSSRKEWNEFVMSTENRLMRFLGSETIKRFLGLPTGNLDILDVMDQGKILLVNLGSTRHLAREEARVFASLLLNEFFEAAMYRAEQGARGQRPHTFTLYLDEFQEYMTEDIAGMLDQVRKGGLHLVLAHQHFGHFEDNERVKESILTNARIRAVFGGLTLNTAELLANEMFLRELNTREVKATYYRTAHLYEEETRTVVSRTATSGNGSSRGASSSSGTSATRTNTEGITEGQGESTTNASTSSTSLSNGGATAAGRAQSAGLSTSLGVSHFGNDRLLPAETDGSFSIVKSENQSESISELDSEDWSKSESDSEMSSETQSTFVSVSSSQSDALSRSAGTTQSRSKSESRAVSEGQTVVPFLRPVPIQELASEADYTLEEKRSKIAAMLKHQERQRCFIKLGDAKTESVLVPTVKDAPVPDDILARYRARLFELQGAVCSEAADRLIAENELRFLGGYERQTLPDKSARRTAVRSKKDLLGLIGTE